MKTPPVQIPEPKNLKESPDSDTKKGLPDFTGDGHADHRVLFIKIKDFLKYGTNDKVHAAAIIFSLLLFTVIVLVIFIGFFCEHSEWADKVFTWLGSAFLFSLGIAFGSRDKKNIRNEEDDDFDPN